MRTQSRILIIGLCMYAAACGRKDVGASAITAKRMADSLYLIVAADRAVYTKEIVERLGQEKLLRTTERYKDDHTLPLPAQMLRMGAERVARSDKTFTYNLLSLWPINKQNAAATPVEKTGLKQVADSGEPYYSEEKLGGRDYFTAVYPDKAVAEACVSCHNASQESPRTDFRLGEVMGGVVIRIPVD